jgi:uncharacterized membrane protein
MPMELHELHPMLVHMPLALLPAAALVDVAAASADSRPRRYLLDAAGRKLWWAGVGAAALAGVAGMAASQEVRADDPRARDAMWLHGIGNLGILLAGIGLASWRTTHRVSPVSAVLGASAVGASIYTAWLGGELVYTHGIGVKAMGATAPAGVERRVPLRSWRAPGQLLADAGRGLVWLLGRGGKLAARKEPLAAGAATQADRPPALSATPSAPVIPGVGSGSQLRPIG